MMKTVLQRNEDKKSSPTVATSTLVPSLSSMWHKSYQFNDNKGIERSGGRS